MIPLQDPEGHRWVKPVGRRLRQTDCPDCACCTEQLCTKAREQGRMCLALASVRDYAMVEDCPCCEAARQAVLAALAAEIGPDRVYRGKPAPEPRPGVTG